MIVSGMFVCNSFLIRVYVFCVESCTHIECYSDCSCSGSHLVEPICYVLFSVCSAVTVECCVLYRCCMGVFGMFAVKALPQCLCNY